MERAAPIIRQHVPLHKNPYPCGREQHGLLGVSKMRKKYGKLYADWRDQHSQRTLARHFITEDSDSRNLCVATQQ